MQADELGRRPEDERPAEQHRKQDPHVPGGLRPAGDVAQCRADGEDGHNDDGERGPDRHRKPAVAGASVQRDDNRQQGPADPIAECGTGQGHRPDRRLS